VHLASALDHAFGDVEADHLVEVICQRAGHPPQPAAEVERCPARPWASKGIQASDDLLRLAAAGVQELVALPGQTRARP
jgi:hypothetical protein